MKTYQILDSGGRVVNNIVADEAFLNTVFPNQWRLAPEAEVPAPENPPESKIITKLAFRNRFTAAEKSAIELAAVHDSAASDEQQQRAAALRAYLKDLDAASFIDLDSEYIAQACQMLETAGLLASGRAEQITDAPVQPEELP